MKPTDKKNFFDKMTDEEKQVFMDKMGTFRELMMLYTCALKEVATKFEVLNEEFSVRYNRNPVENIKTNPFVHQSYFHRHTCAKYIFLNKRYFLLV